ncbi:MAG: DsbA family oxidoreductase [Williamsia herbipolensis]|nr:DsbA family oxidoreductase [Williamsia herbipolensis]
MSVSHTDSPPVLIEVWSDLGCPWCYIGKHRLQAAIAERPDRDRYTVRVRSFELNSSAPRIPETIESAFVRSHGGDASTVIRAERQMQTMARQEGLPFTLDRLNANTVDVHRLVHFAREHGLGEELFGLVQDRFFAGEINPFDVDALVDAAGSLGLPADRVREVLAGDEFADAVRADIAEGRRLGVTGVPFVVVDRRLAAAGAQSVAAYRKVLDDIDQEHR